MKLNELSPKEGSTKSRMRVGRGIGSGKGKTCGRGVKGQKSRSGVSIKGFEGGQMPLYMRLPKVGFKSRNRKNMQSLSLGRLQAAIDAKKLDAKKDITEDTLVDSGVIRRKKDGIRLLASGDLTAKVSLTLSGASEKAKAAVEKAGGSLTIIERQVAPVKNPRRPKSDA